MDSEKPPVFTSASTRSDTNVAIATNYMGRVKPNKRAGISVSASQSNPNPNQKQSGKNKDWATKKAIKQRCTW